MSEKRTYNKHQRRGDQNAFNRQRQCNKYSKGPSDKHGQRQNYFRKDNIDSQRQTQYDSKSERLSSEKKTFRDNKFENEHKLFVGGISPNTSEDCIRRKFSKYGKITFVKLINKGAFSICFISFQELEAMENALQEMNGKEIDGKSVFTQKAKPRQFEPNKDKSGDGCFNCGEHGHFARQCPKPRKPRQFNKQKEFKQPPNLKNYSKQGPSKDKFIDKSGKTDSGSESSLQKSIDIKKKKQHYDNNRSNSNSLSKSPIRSTQVKQLSTTKKLIRKSSSKSRSPSPKRQKQKDNQPKNVAQNQKNEQLRDPRDRTRDKNSKKRKNSSDSGCSD